MENDKIKHLEFIQAIIKRMNANSFQIKTWTVTIIAAIFAIYSSNKEISILLFALIPLIIFWLLDSFYLLQEKKYRDLFNNIIGLNEIKQNIKTFDLNANDYKKGICSFLVVMFSKTIFWFYFSLILISLILYIYLGVYKNG